MGNYVSSPFGSVTSLYQFTTENRTSTEALDAIIKSSEEMLDQSICEWVDLQKIDQIQELKDEYKEGLAEESKEEVEEKKEEKEEKEETKEETKEEVKYKIPEATPLKLTSNQKKRKRKQGLIP